jgi:kinesin family member C2/C3
VDCVLALKSFSERSKTGRYASCKYGGILKPLTSRKYFILNNSDAFMNKNMRNHLEAFPNGFSDEPNISTDCSLELHEVVSIVM